jgi:hypothetical protein
MQVHFTGDLRIQALFDELLPPTRRQNVKVVKFPVCNFIDKRDEFFLVHALIKGVDDDIYSTETNHNGR